MGDGERLKLKEEEITDQRKVRCLVACSVAACQRVTISKFVHVQMEDSVQFRRTPLGKQKSVHWTGIIHHRARTSIHWWPAWLRRIVGGETVVSFLVSDLCVMLDGVSSMVNMEMNDGLLIMLAAHDKWSDWAAEVETWFLCLLVVCSSLSILDWKLD